MAAKGSVTFAQDICKGCGLCVNACKFDAIAIDTESINAKGYHPVFLAAPENCTGCSSCAIMCPDVVITVMREK